MNAMTDVPSGEMYIANGCELSMRSPKHTIAGRTETDVWHVYARYLPQGDKMFVTDLVVFDATTRQLVEVMLGVQYGRVAKASMSKMLARMTKDESALRIKASSAAPRDSAPPAALPATTDATAVVAKPKPTKKKDSTKTKSGSSIATIRQAGYHQRSAESYRQRLGHSSRGDGARRRYGRLWN